MATEAPTVDTTAAPDEATNVIDTSPALSPSAGDGTETLASRLSRRPDAQDLVNRNILHDASTHTAPSLQQKKAELEHAMVVDSLKKGLAIRPDRGELIEKGIIPEAVESGVAPGLLQKRKTLERNMLSDQLNNKLSNRPDADKLIDEGILNADEDPRKE